MDCSEARLDKIEAQKSTDESYDTESVPEFLNNLRLSDLYNFPGEYVEMNSEIFSAMRAGNTEFLEKMKSYGTPMACFKNNKGDSILHIAAAFGHLELVESIVLECPSLLLEPNWKDQIPLHVAAHARHSAVVKVLSASVTCFSARLSEEERERLDLYVLKDINGDTPLHLALKDLPEKAELLMNEERIRNQESLCHVIMHWRRSSRSMTFSDASIRVMETAAYLVSANQNVSFVANKDGISPLYLAVEAGNVSLVNAMLSRSGYMQSDTSHLASKLEGRKSLVHVALKAKNTDVVDVILNEDPSFVNERDEEGRTCLSVGASVGFYEGIYKLLDRSTSSVFECDDDGSFPIHMAVEKGHVNVVKELLKRCPDSIEQLSKEGQNILHIAAKSGKVVGFLMDYISRLEKKKTHLIEEQDVDGNTPLHLATINWRPRSVESLTEFASTKSKILKIQNNDGLRALDIAELHLHSDYIFRQRMTLMVLLCVYKPRGVAWIPTSGMTLRSKSEQLVGGEKYKDRVNILLLVAALVATMTFAAGFTMPGGFNGSAPNSGMAILVDDPNLSNFLLFDTLAMQCSVVATVTLIWAQLGDQELAHRAFHLALPLLFIALLCMFVAFAFGVLATIKQNSLLTNQIHVITVILGIVMVFLLAPYVIPQVYGIPCIQFYTRIYLSLLLFLVNEDDSEKHYTSSSGHRALGSSGDDQVEKSKVL